MYSVEKQCWGVQLALLGTEYSPKAVARGCRDHATVIDSRVPRLDLKDRTLVWVAVAAHTRRYDTSASGKWNLAQIERYKSHGEWQLNATPRVHLSHVRDFVMLIN